MVNNTAGVRGRTQNTREIECWAKEFALYASNKGDPGKGFEKENDMF